MGRAMARERATLSGTLRQGGAPVFEFPEHERQQERAAISRDYTREQQAKKRCRREEKNWARGKEHGPTHKTC